MWLVPRLFRWLTGKTQQLLMSLMAEDGCLFRILYWLYANTRLGQLMVRRDIRLVHRKYRGTGCHSAVVPQTFGHIQIIPVPQLFDNYGYLVTDTVSGDTAVIDVSDAAVVRRCCEQHSLKPSAILTTHKHWDHCCGTKDLKDVYRSLKIYGSQIDRPHGTTKFLKPVDKVQVGTLTFHCHMTPGHTHGHTVFHLEQSDSLFTGDLLFIAGCGKVFEGTTETMLASLDLVCGFRDSTLIWPGHEYSKNNLRFASELEKSNPSQREKLNWVYHQLQERLPTCPSSLLAEKQYNPFLRTSEPSLLVELGLLVEPPPIQPSIQTDAELIPSPSQTDSESICVAAFDSVSFHSCVELDPSVPPPKSSSPVSTDAEEIPSEVPATDSSALLQTADDNPSAMTDDSILVERSRLRVEAFQLIRKRKNRFDKTIP